MLSSSSMQSTLQRYQQDIYTALRRAVYKVSDVETHPELNALQAYYGQMQYHLGWVDTNFSPTRSNFGKFLRPTLLLLSYEAAGAWGLATNIPDNDNYLCRALPAAAAVELTHNFTLIHDDIEDGDAERRHRSTLWKIWGVPQAINTGDGMFALSRLTLWDVLEEGVEGSIAARLGALLDHACLVLAEGQYLDISFEKRLDISVAMYVDMISRKTAALMRCAAEMGARLGTRDEETIDRLCSFGWAIGIAFQVRDDILGVWASTTELGKTPTGDIYRRKKSLPILHALEHANSDDQALLQAIYMQAAPVTREQVERVLAVFARTNTKAYCYEFLAQQCKLAYEALASVPRHGSPLCLRALSDLETLVGFVEETVKA
ncbi:MAG: polyprenyl synthetase family protein [Chloroflexi bacterium]|nr:polyprenyl synthetase family protein [Ktedonobacteraceae bacterium]MBV9021377.1 polyprenyl synthetase family protein [Ktedonobacteraceae bacterium]MBV9707857.1 polyprenyl synthetase family protein [Chloroflexota bacterium]